MIPFNLLRYFSAASASAIFVLGLVVWFGHGNFAVSDAIRARETYNVELARSFSNALWPKYGKFVMSAKNESALTLASNPAIREIGAFLHSVTDGLSILKVKIYNIDGLTVYSSEAKQIGERKANDPSFRKVVETGSVVTAMSFRDQFSAFSGEAFNRDVVETYIPVLNSNGIIEGVFEIYSDATKNIDDINKQTNYVIVGYLLTALFLYLSLIFIVKRADLIIKAQDSDLRIQARRANDQLRWQLSTEQARMRDILSLAGGVAHEVSNPLSSFLAQLDALEPFCSNGEMADLPRIAEGIYNLRSTADRISAVLHRLLAFPDVSDGGEKLQQVDVNELMAAVLDVVRISDHARYLNIQQKLSNEVPPTHVVRGAVLLSLYMAITELVEISAGRILTLSAETAKSDCGVEITLRLEGQDNDFRQDNAGNPLDRIQFTANQLAALGGTLHTNEREGAIEILITLPTV